MLETINLQCIISGENARGMWRQDGSPSIISECDPNDMEVRLCVEANMEMIGKTIYTLKMRDIRPEDAGNYRCHSGSENDFIHITVGMINFLFISYNNNGPKTG